MVFAIVIILMLVAIGFFHYIQGFFSSAISAVLAIISAVLAVGFFETLVEGPLANTAPEWMPALLLLGLFAVIYVVLRTIFDKAIPGGMQIPAVMDKIGGAVMGLIAGTFAMGIIAVAAQYLPFGPTIAGYGRYETQGQRDVIVPGGGGSGRGAASKDAATFDEVAGDNFQSATRTKMLVPVDDILISMVEHLSGDGAFSTGKPFQSVHPDLLQELFGTRIGIQNGGTHTIVATPDKKAFDVLGVFDAPALKEQQIVDSEFKQLRTTPVKITTHVPQDEMRIVVRVRFTAAAGDPKDKKIRLSPASVRLVAKRPSEYGVGLEPHNYFPIGTLDPSGRLYLNKIDDFMFIDYTAKRIDGSEGPGEVDFVFQVKKKGFLEEQRGGGGEKVADGVFLEIKRRARADLGVGDVANIKSSMKPITSLAVKRKHLELAGGPAPLGEKGKGGAPVAPEPTAGSGGGGELGQRLAGTWESRGLPGSSTDVYTFTADGGFTKKSGSNTESLRWSANGPPQGETLSITAGNEKLTILFVDQDTFELTSDAGAKKRFVRTAGGASQSTSAVPDSAKAKLFGTWENDQGLSYTFKNDGTFSGFSVASNISGRGVWKVLGVEGDVITIELTNDKGRVTPLKWRVAGDQPSEITRVEPAPPQRFKRKQ